MVACVAAILAVAPAWAQVTDSFGWEDGTSTALGFFDSGNLTMENSGEQANGGTRSLKMTENPSSGTPQAYIWWVNGLVDGDQVTASFWVYDTTVGTNPSGRIWGHYTSDPMDINSYSGSAGGNDTYSDGSGWSQLSWTWTFASDGDDTGLVVEARIYSGADGDFIYIDDAEISVTAAGPVTITAPDGTTVPVELQSFSVE
jgi:hypothetical protein